MLVVIGLILLILAVVAGVAGVMFNADSTHILSDNFSLFGFDVAGSTGTVFLFGIVVGAVAMLGISLLLAGARRSARRGHDARRGLQESRRETASAVHERDDLITKRDAGGGARSSRTGDAPGS